MILLSTKHYARITGGANSIRIVNEGITPETKQMNSRMRHQIRRYNDRTQFTMTCNVDSILKFLE